MHRLGPVVIAMCLIAGGCVGRTEVTSEVAGITVVPEPSIEPESVVAPTPLPTTPPLVAAPGATAAPTAIVVPTPAAPPSPGSPPTPASTPTPTPTRNCSAPGEPAEATVTDVSVWVRARSGPSRSAPELAQLALGSTVRVWPASLTFDGLSLWWVAAELPDEAGCGYVAARFLVDDLGHLDRRLQGIAVDFPPTAEWSYQVERQAPGLHGWTLQGADGTELTIEVVDGLRIDQWLDELTVPRGEGEPMPEPSFDRLELDGADRAIRLRVGPTIDDPSMGERWITFAEVGDRTYRLEAIVAEVDTMDVPLAAMRQFVSSASFDRTAFTD